jgi:23S rRNA (adenine2503-C2)-methyltransferase
MSLHAVAPESRTSVKGLLLEELEDLLSREGAPRYAAGQVFSWLYSKKAESFEKMTDLKRDLRERLVNGYTMKEAALVGEQAGADGTRKLLVRMHDGERVESVIIPDEGRSTLCVSSQAGCARGCAFCATATMGLHRNLTAGEIVEQALIASRITAVTNAVFMGMGEPMDNYEAVKRAIYILTSNKGFGLGARHVTVSTVGVVPGILRLAKERVPAGLTVSLTAPDDELRSTLVPANRTWPIAQVMDACKKWADAMKRDATIAYVLMAGVNDSPRHSQALAKLARKARAKVNLIPCNPARGFQPPPDSRVYEFQTELKASGVLALYRKARGGDISAACGQLVVSGGSKSAPKKVKSGA